MSLLLILASAAAPLSYSYEQIVSEISTTGQIQIYHCAFSNFALSSGSGSAIYQMSYSPLSVNHSSFFNCTAPSYGGCIYSNNSAASIALCCFELCYITTQQNQLFGNVMYIEGDSISTNCTAAYQCGPTTYASDTSFFLYSQSAFSTNSNFTQCDGYGGGAAIDLYRSLSVASTAINIQYCHVCNSHNWHAFVHESTYDSSTIAYVDIINNTFDNQMFWFNTGSATVEYSYIFGTTYSAVCSNSAATFVGCYADFSYSGITATGLTITVSIGRHPYEQCASTFQFTLRHRPLGASRIFFLSIGFFIGYQS